MKQKTYEESISKDLLERIKTFLNANKEDVLDYKTCMEGYKLASQAFNELCESRSDYHRDYDEIIKKLKCGINISIQDTINNNKVINELNELISRMIEDNEARDLIEQLYRKKYK